MARQRLKVRQPARGIGAEVSVVEPANPTSQTKSGNVRLFRAALVCAGLVFLVALALYSWTLAPTVTLVDSGELIVVARFLGIAHPPGMPLWVMLAHFASLAPWGSVASRINFSSAVFAAVASAMLTLAVAELMRVLPDVTAGRRSTSRKNPRKSRKTGRHAGGIEIDEDSGIRGVLILAPALGAGLLIAFSRTLWSYATITEVYALNAMLILAIFFLIFRWRQCILTRRKRVDPAKGGGRSPFAVTDYDALLYAGAVVFGLALGVHHVTVGLLLPALGIIVYRTEGLGFFRSRRLLYAAIVSVIALLAVYAYLPLAASRTPIINWGTPRSLTEIWWHITGRQYLTFFAFTPAIMGKQLIEFGGITLREFGLPWVPLVLALALVGSVSLWKRDRTIFWFLAAIVVVDVVYTIGFNNAEDRDAYFLPAFISIAVAAAFGLRWLIELLLRTTPVKSASLAAAFPILLVSVVALAGNLPVNNRRHYFIAHDYVENLFSAIEPNGLLLTMDWQVASPMFYAQEIEQRRRDVKVIDVNLLHRPWYYGYLRHAYPDMIERSRDQVDAFFGDLKEWEHNPNIYASDPVLNRRITTRFHEMVRSIVTNENRVGPVYITSDVPFADKRDSELTKWLNQTYQLVPQGLVFNLADGQTFHDSRDVELQTRGLADGTLRFEKDDIVSLKLLPVYTSMLINRGRYLALFSQHERAITAFKQALTINPDLPLAEQGLQQSTSKLRSP
jgi:hypothetical protein